MTTAAQSYLAVTIPGRLPQIANGRLHWAAKARLVVGAKEEAWAAMVSCRNGLSMPPASERRKLSVVVYMAGRPFDRDNLFANAKPLVDGAKVAGWIRDDSPEWCDLEVKQIRVTHKLDQRVEIEVTW